MNGKCYCGTSRCVGTLFPRIIRDEESGDEGGNEGDEVGNEEKMGSKDDDIEAEGGDTGDGDGMDLDLQAALEPLD